MSFAKMLGLDIGGQISKPIDAITGMIDQIYTTPGEKIDKKTMLEKVRQSPQLLALQISMMEAQSSDKWTSRARPMVLYGFVLVFVVQNALLPTLFWFFQMFNPEVAPPPAALSMDAIMTVVSGVLGTSWIASRGIEKVKKAD